MAKFTYTGEDGNGKSVTKQVTAEDRFAVYEIARQDGNTVVTIEESGKFSLQRFINVERINYYLSRVSKDELVMLARNLGSMLDAGLTVTRALSVIERQSSNPRLKGVVKDVIERVNSGDEFYEALSEYPETFDDLFVSMIKAGEQSGGLAEALDTLATQLERSSNLSKKIKGAMIYPAIVITVMFIIGVLMMIYVVPSVTTIFEGSDVELPMSTQILIGISNFLTEYTLVALASILFFIFSVVYFFKSKPGRYLSSWIVPRLPVIGTLAKETNAARTARTFASLLNAGVEIMQTIEITEDVVQNVFYKEVLREARLKVEKGNPLSTIFIERTDLYPVLVGEMILVGEETGKIAGMMKELAIFYENEVERKTKDLSTIIEPILMVFIGGGVGFFALAMISPIYGISATMKS